MEHLSKFERRVLAVEQELITSMVQIADSLSRVHSEYGWMGSECRRMRLYATLDLSNTAHFLEVLTTLDGVSTSLENMSDCYDSNRVLACRATAWLETVVGEPNHPMPLSDMLGCRARLEAALKRMTSDKTFPVGDQKLFTDFIATTMRYIDDERDDDKLIQITQRRVDDLAAVMYELVDTVA